MRKYKLFERILKESLTPEENEIYTAGYNAFYNDNDNCPYDPQENRTEFMIWTWGYKDAEGELLDKEYFDFQW